MTSELDRAPLPRWLQNIAERVVSDQSALHEMTPLGAAAAVWASVAALVLFVVLLAANLAPKGVWVFGVTVGVPLALQWLTAFVAGVVVALRIKLRQERNRQVSQIARC